MAKAQNCGTLAKEAGLTSTISSTSHPIKGSPTTRAVVAPASSAGSVVRPRSLHAHAFTWGFIICPYFSSAALKDLNIPTTKQMRIKEQCKNSTKHSCSEVNQTKKKKKNRYDTEHSPVLHVQYTCIWEFDISTLLTSSYCIHLHSRAL